MASGLGLWTSPVTIDSEISGSGNDSEYCSESDPETGDGVASDSLVYVYEESLIDGMMELNCCSSTSVAPLARVNPAFSDPFHMQRPIPMPGVKPRSKRRCTSLPPAPFQDYVASVFKDEHIAAMRNTYHIPKSVVLRAPLDHERAHHSRPDEIVVYEAFFALGMRETVPPLIATVARFVNISPGQFTPTTWRVLTSIQVLGEFSEVDVGIEEILYVYFFKSHNIDMSRCMIHTRGASFPPLVYDFSRDDIRKIAYEKGWQTKFMFMRVGLNPNFPVDWFFRDFRFPQCREGEYGALALVGGPRLSRSTCFLTSRFALEKSSIWCNTMSYFSIPVGESALEAFRRAAENDEVKVPALMHIEELPDSRVSSRRPTMTDGSRPPSKPHRKRGSSSRCSLLTVFDHSSALTMLNKDVFTLDVGEFTDIGHNDVFDASQGYLLQAMSAFHYAKAKLAASRQDVTNLQTSLDKMTLASNAGKERYQSDMTAKEVAYQSLKKTYGDKIAALEEIEKDLRLEVKREKKKVLMATSAAAVMNRWEMISNYKRGNAELWNAREAENDRREILIKEAEINGRPPPVFPDSFTDFSGDTPVFGTN